MRYLIVFLPLVMSGEAAAQTASWVERGAWQIREDLSVGGCYAAAQYDNGVVLRIGLDVRQSRLTLAVGNPRWKMQSGQIYRLNIQVGDNWRATTRANDDVLLFGASGSAAEDFFHDLTTQPVITISYDDRWIGTYRLNGIKAAMAAVAQCQYVKRPIG